MVIGKPERVSMVHIYPFSTENIKGYYELLDLEKGKQTEKAQRIAKEVAQVFIEKIATVQ